MGLRYPTFLSSKYIYGCGKCKSHLASREDIISRDFQGQHGRAYLFDTVVNVADGKEQDRNMTTGRHKVKDISCKRCHTVLGWTYVKAYSEENKYKEGKFILERELLAQVI